MKQQEILDVIGSNVGDAISKGHLDFSPFSAVQGQYGCLTPPYSPECAEEA